MNILETLFKFAGGIGMFLYGMNVMADGLQKSAGNKMKNLLRVLTHNKLLAVLVGTGITAIIQSSSATTVMVVGFVNAGMMSLSQAVGIIMGANIGTTATAWIVSMGEWSQVLKPEFIAPLLVAIGSFTILFTKSEKKKEVAEIIIGFGLLFIGLTLMSDVIAVYKDSPIFSKAFIILGKNPLLGLLVGAVVTAIIQSSSASVGILQTLAMSGLVSWSSAIFITLGQNIGTCITSILSAIGANKTAKRAAAIHLIFNVVGSIIFGTLFYIIFKLKPDFGTADISSVQISMFHTFFNLTNTIILFPFSDLLIKLSGIFIDDSKEEQNDDGISLTLRHLDDRILETPFLAVENATKEVIHMGEVTLENVKESIMALLENEEASVKKVKEKEKVINAYAKLITNYLIKINNLSLTEEQQLTVNRLFNIISNIERVGDHAENLAELSLERIDNLVRFSDDAYLELKEICNVSLQSYKLAIQVLETGDLTLIEDVSRLEIKVDRLEEEFRRRHILRLSQGVCTSEIGVLFIDAIINLERISDHSLNIANYVKDEINNA